MRLAVVSGNTGKLAEYRVLLGRVGLTVVRCAAEVQESGRTYTENARIKARAGVEATGVPSIGDDSGLEVAALGGFPGIRSSRLAPTQAERDAAVLDRLRDVTQPWTARYVCAIVLAYPDGTTVTSEESRDGVLLPAPRGMRGFGYDPLFYIPEAGLTLAEMDMSTRAQWSHRAAALRGILLGLRGDAETASRLRTPEHSGGDRSGRSVVTE
jgi:XTP/dITP diphosphohydrolase